MTIQSLQTQWQFLEKRPHRWRKQLYIKGRKQRAFTLWMNMLVNEMTPEEVADNWELPLAAVHEVIEYCETHQELLQQEADIERRHLEEKGIPIEPKTTQVNAVY
ncbi:MAG: hypothetical protein QNJ33_05550 [Crocosphaera sp.]|nr:hypothetical protein [Crocosphaera sp.]